MQNFISSIQRRIDRQFGRRPTSYPYISGDSFRAYAQHVYGDPDATLNPANIKNGDVVFIRTNRVQDFMSTIHPQISARYVVITHNSDAKIDESYRAWIDDQKIIHWFGQNVMIEHPKLTPIPIGLENLHYHINGQTSLFNQIRNAEKKNPVFKKMRVLFGFNVGTNKEVRTPALAALKMNPMADGIDKVLGTTNHPSPAEYLKALNSYAMVASPEGNGPDCHRTWEAIYLGVSPIVTSSAGIDYFKHLQLPLTVVTSWNDIPVTPQSLRARYDTVWVPAKFDALWMDYWIAEIENARKTVI